ncbi:MAG: Gfo/Idh/MocA family oxidoreductase [Clostridia bacterium]|nr:Gfo/Idh/MocA family oxidoreductase [Clostridia bacterium]
MKTVKLGIFGFWRGQSLVDDILALNGEIVAVCDKSEKRLNQAKQKLGNTTALYKEFDEFIEHEGIEAVLLANYFHEHSEYAIRCLEKGIHVLSECLSNSTMAEGVKLVEAAEKSKAKYMLLENYPFMLFNQEMKRVADGKTLGKILYAEGEYNHSVKAYGNGEKDTWEDICNLYDSDKHWRWFLPSTYYVTHSLAPIMYATGASPVRVTAMPVFYPQPRECDRVKRTGEKAAIITTLNDDNSVFKFTGCSGFGGSENSYRLCGEKGMIENVRGTGGKIMLRYNKWEIPEGREEINYYNPEWNDKDEELIKAAGHGGGDFCIIREFLSCIREDKKPTFDVYFATRMASVAILGHRSLMGYGMPYDIPDFRRKEDRDKYRFDNATPFYYSDGREPNIPCGSHPDYKPSEQQFENINKILKGRK